MAERGWVFAGGAGNVYYLERPIADTECSRLLYMIGWLLGDEAEIEKYGTEAEPSMDWAKIPYGMFVFAVQETPVCGEHRYAE